MHTGFALLRRALLPALLSIITSSNAQPLLIDGGFEQGGEEWTILVPQESASAEPTLSVVTTPCHSGAHAARLNSSEQARYGLHVRGPERMIPVIPGQRYRVSGWFRADPGLVVGQGTPGLLVRLTLRDAAKADADGGHLFIGLDDWVGRDLEPPANTRLPTEWTKIEAVVEIPEGVAWMIPTFFVWRAAGAIYFDDLAVEAVPADTPLTPISTTRARPTPPPSAPSAAELLTEEKQAEIFAALDLDLPGLQAVKAAVQAGDLSTARGELAAYLRNRPGDFWFFAPVDPAHPEADFTYRAVRAESAAVGRITPSGLAELWHTFPDNIIDWYRNETRYRPGLAFNQEWQFQLCRMSFWGDMANAYRATGDEKYPRAWVTQLRSFIAQCPPPHTLANHLDSTWRTIECGIRMRDSWPRAFTAFLHSPSVTDEDLLLYLHSNLQHARYMRAFPSDWGNWLTMEMCGLHTIGTVFPEFKDAAAWRAFAIETLQASIARQFLPDGSQYELTPGYHIVSLDENGMAIPRLARATGRLDEIPPSYIASLEKGYDFLLHMMTPDRSQPQFNDSWPITWLPRVFNNGLLFFPHRSDWHWVATDGAEGSPPSTTSHAFPDAGYYVMRSGWERDANYLAFDAGPPGYAHQHQDKLNLVFWVYGREILFDGGGGSYESSPWRHYATDTFSHNTILVDGKPQRRPISEKVESLTRDDGDVIWESTPEYDFVAASYEGAYASTGMREGPQPIGPAVHTRRVLFAKPDLVIVADTLAPNDDKPHTYQARWHLLPVAISTDDSTKTVVTTEPGKSNLAVIPLRTDGLELGAVSAQIEPERLGWNVRKDMDPQYVPATTVLHTRGGAGVQSFLTLLYPLRPGEPNPVSSVIPLNETDTRIKLANGGSFLVHVPAAPMGRITLTCD